MGCAGGEKRGEELKTAREVWVVRNPAMSPPPLRPPDSESHAAAGRTSPAGLQLLHSGVHAGDEKQKGECRTSFLFFHKVIVKGEGEEARAEWALHQLGIVSDLMGEAQFIENKSWNSDSMGQDQTSEEKPWNPEKETYLDLMGQACLSECMEPEIPNHFLKENGLCFSEHGVVYLLLVLEAIAGSNYLDHYLPAHEANRMMNGNRLQFPIFGHSLLFHWHFGERKSELLAMVKAGIGKLDVLMRQENDVTRVQLRGYQFKSEIKGGAAPRACILK